MIDHMKIINVNLNRWGNPDFVNWRYIITDLPDVTELIITDEQVEEAAAYSSAASISNPRIKGDPAGKDEHVQMVTRLYKCK